MMTKRGDNVATFSEFFNYAYGNVFDTNGTKSSSKVVQTYYPYAGQCVSLIKAYMKYGGCTLGSWGNAIAYWTNRYTVMKPYYSVVTGSPQNGDVGVSSGGNATYGHVFIYYNGQAFAQNVSGSPYAKLSPLSYQGTIYGYLRPKFMSGTSTSTSTYNESQLINENGTATLTVAVKKRRDTPDGLAVETLPKGKKLTYTQKWVGNGHRYISWVETEPNGNKYRYFVAVSGSETRGQDMWATIGEASQNETEQGFSENQITEEHGWATLTEAVKKRRDTPNGLAVETLTKGKVLEYTGKWVGNGHRYITWVEHQADGHSYRYFVAISGSETQGKDLWASFSATDPTKKTSTNNNSSSQKSSENKPKTSDNKNQSSDNKIDTSNVKHWGADISYANPNADLSQYEFAIIRASYGTNTDKLFEQNVQKAEKANIPYGVYCYSYALSEEDAVSEAKYIIDLIKDKKPTLGVWFDMEDADYYKAKNNCLDYATLGKFCKQFCDTVKAHGYYTGIYSTPSWFTAMGGLDDYDKWIAQWNTNDGTYQSDTSSLGTIHQYTSKPLDKNAMYVDFDHYKVNTSDTSKTSENTTQNDPQTDSKDTNTSSKQQESDTTQKETNSLLKVLIELLKKLLSVFGK